MTTERVHFRLTQMPCCQHLFCNVNPRLPSFCPMCGNGVYPQVKSCILISDESAMLKYREDGVSGQTPPAGESHDGMQSRRSLDTEEST